MLFVDATNTLQWGPNPPTGIPRVEASLVREVLTRHADKTALFTFDPTLRRCRALNVGEKRFVGEWLAFDRVVQLETANRASWLTRVRNESRVYRYNAICCGRESHRAIAQYLSASPERSGFAYESTRLLVRLCFAGLRAGYGLARTVSREVEADPLQDDRNSCLLSINTCSLIQKYYRPEHLRASLSLLIYDTIPLDYPDLAARGHAARFSKYFKFGVAQARQLICISEATRQSVIKWCRDDLDARVKADKARVIQIASALADDGSATSPVEDLVGKSFVLYCATIEPRKNHLLLLRVWAGMLSRRSEVPLLVFVGRWGWRTEAVRKQIADDRRLATVVKVYPSLSDDRLRWLYSKTLFCVFPSIAEGWGLGASEALDFGAPVVVSDIPPLREATQA